MLEDYSLIISLVSVQELLFIVSHISINTLAMKTQSTYFCPNGMLERLEYVGVEVMT